MGEIRFISGMLFTVVFAIAVISFVIGFGVDNNVAVNLADDPEISELNTNLNSDVKVFRRNINDSSGVFFKIEIETNQETTQTGGVFKGGMLQLPKMITKIISLGGIKIFGGSTAFAIVTTAIISFMSFVAILYIWKTWKGGNPD